MDTIKKVYHPGASLSVIVPVYNEAKNVAALYRELLNVLETIPGNHEIIFINDGSTDTTLAELKQFEDISIIDLRRNYGQATALDAGFKEARGDIVVSLDGDGQNSPQDIPLLLEMMQEKGLDVVAGWRKERRDPGSVLFITWAGCLLRQLFIKDGVHDSGCTLRAYTQTAAKSLDIGGEMHRYILALLRWKGFTIGEVRVTHRPRIHGTSNYGSGKAIRGFIDLLYIWFIYKYSQRPLHLFGYISLVTFAVGIVAGSVSIYNKLFLGLNLNRSGWFFISLFLLLTGVIFFTFGIVIDILLRFQLTLSPYEKRYYVREIIKT